MDQVKYKVTVLRPRYINYFKILSMIYAYICFSSYVNCGNGITVLALVYISTLVVLGDIFLMIRSFAHTRSMTRLFSEEGLNI